MKSPDSTLRGIVALLCALLAAAVAVVAAAETAVRSKPRYAAQIRWTSHGIPHISAPDMGSLGFGEGYAFARDHLCSLLDQVVRVRGERARYFGAGTNDAHLNSDITFRALRIVEQARALHAAMPRPERQLFAGYAAGVNRYLRDTGAQRVPGWCRGEAWVREITAVDLLAYGHSFVVSSSSLGEQIATATPPQADGARIAQAVEPVDSGQASNGWAVGSQRSAAGGGMLLASPHYPWIGANRFWEKHLTIPGKLDVYGVSLLGMPGVTIGFNRAVAWTHTVSAGKRHVFYALELVPGDPTRYRVDGKVRRMTSRVVGVEVRQADGTLRRVERRLYASHHGPIVNLPGFEWTAMRAVAIRDANANNTSYQRQRAAISASRSLEEFRAAHARYNAMPWINTIAASADGRAWYADTAATVNLRPQAISEWLQRRDVDPATKAAWGKGRVLLDGSRSLFDPVTVRGTRPGVIPSSRMPQLERRDYVFNANDSYWLANPQALLRGYSPLQGDEDTARSLRTRINGLLLEDLSPDGPSGPDGRFSLDELADAALGNRGLGAELLRPELVRRCAATPSVTVDGQEVDLAPACRILAAWDGRYESDRAGAVLWREFITQYDPADLRRAGALFASDFDPLDPLRTPHTLAADADPAGGALVRLARAVLLLERNGIALDVPLGRLQYSAKDEGRIPIHGGEGAYDGIANFVNFAPNTTTLEPFAAPERIAGSRFLTKEGYPVNRGTSFIMALEYTPQGPRAKALLTYSQSGDPASPLFHEQTTLFSAKRWRPILFTDAEIEADPKLEVLALSE
jgi:acyl-homoserine-lactone acylase